MDAQLARETEDPYRPLYREKPMTSIAELLGLDITIGEPYPGFFGS
ncbi:hypothetical protein [Rhodococcus xishaensis]|nr:hypothetical protein [Rhodococcus xishaensis]